ncbi:5'-3' exonuclease [Virgibacillus sp. MSP4-1]|uniref:5'-3' exonuclease n=1 Tax=Virgibacillus sp. MSP4-1 TaxID=2700081 RepID=UPI0003A656F6|nr:5'-3' exonuclease [Virgibacillus sp. MSP4-1]
MNKNDLMIVDGMALLFRGFFATSFTGNFMMNSKGVPTNGIFGFMRYFLNAVQTFKPTHVICCWDMGSKTFRNDKYESYKANRSAPPEELIPQFDLVKEAVESFGVPNIGMKGYEADDCIGTLAKQYGKQDNVLILTGDQDILQLVDENIRVAIMKKGQGNYAVYHKDNFLEEKGIHPMQIVDIKGLMGDTSDNYPGVKGIGEKTALKLIQQYESIDGILENLNHLSKGIRKKIEENLADLHLSRELAEIFCEVPLDSTLDDARWTVDITRVNQKFEELEFKNLMKQVDKIV